MKSHASEMPPEPPPRHPLHDHIVRFYDSRAAAYDTEDTFHPALAHDLVQWAAQALPARLTSPLKMLDLCCGTGLVAHAARAHFGPPTATATTSIIHGVDISSASLAIARAKADPVPGSSGNMHFYEASATDLASLVDAAGAPLLQKASYGLITCCSAFVFLAAAGQCGTTTRSSRSDILAAWGEYLLPGGVVIFDVPAPDTQLATLYVSRALAARGVPVVDRDWVTGGQSVSDLIDGAEGLECRRVFETRCYKSREYGTGREELEAAWDRLTGNPMSGVESLGSEEREMAKGSFMEMMRSAGGDKGSVRDEYRLLVGIGTKCE